VHIVPIGCIDVCGWILFRNGDSEYAMTGGYIENLSASPPFAELACHDLSGHMHYRHHGLDKLHPVEILTL
jgi:hypothetical protein